MLGGWYDAAKEGPAMYKTMLLDAKDRQALANMIRDRYEGLSPGWGEDAKREAEI